MKVLYTDAIRNDILEEELGAHKVSLEKLIKESDFVSVHVPLLAKTRHLINQDVFKKMKTTACLINTSRGPVVNEAELVVALRNREIAGAALDVYEFEPKMIAGLAELENVVLTPHTASATTASRTNMALKAANNLLAMLKGKKPPDCVNPELYEQ